MNVETETLIDGLLDREADVGSQIVWPFVPGQAGGANYPCSGGSQNLGKLLGAGGWRLTAAVVLVVRIAALNGAAAPTPKKHIGYISAPGQATQGLLIDNADTVYGDLVVLYCSEPNQGL